MVANRKAVVVNSMTVLIVLGLIMGSVGNVGFLKEGSSAITDSGMPLPDVQAQDEKKLPILESDFSDSSSGSNKGAVPDGRVNRLSPDGQQYPEPLAAPWGDWSFRDAHNVPAAENMGLSGDGVVVSVVDTGIDFGVNNLWGTYMVEDRTYDVSSELLIASAEAGQVDAYTDNYYLMAGTLRIWVNDTETTAFTVDVDEGLVQFDPALSVGNVATCSYSYYAPNYGWPMAFDPYAMAPYIKNGKVTTQGWYANTSKNGTGPFDVDHKIKIDGKNDFSNTEKIGSDLSGDVKDPGTSTGWEFDLKELYASRDDKNWYFGIPTRYGAVNRTFGFAIDMDGAISGGLTDPRGNYLDFEPSHPSPIEHLAYEPLNGWVATCAGAGYGGTEGLDTDSPEINMAKVWDTDGTLIAALPSENYPVFSVAWTPDGNYLAYQTKKDVVIIDTSDWSEHWRLEDVTSGAGLSADYQREALSFKDNTELAVGSYIGAGNTIQILDIVAMTNITPLISGDVPRTVSYSPVSGSMLALGHTSAGQITIMETVGYTTTKWLNESKTNSIEVLEWSPTQDRLASGQDTNGTVTIWDVASETPAGFLVGGHGEDTTINSIKWIPGTIITAGADGRVVFWDDTTYIKQNTYYSRYNQIINTIDIDSGTNDVFVGTYDCTVRKHNPTDWNDYTPFVAHMPDTVIYIKYEREYYETTPEGIELLAEEDKIEVPEVYRWNEDIGANGDWEETNLTNIDGEYFYKGLLGGEFTEKGFIEFSISRDFIGWNTSNILYATSFTCGDNESKPQDTCPSDFNVPSPSNAVSTDFVNDNIVSISAFGRLDVPKTIVTHVEIPHQTNNYFYGYHPSKSLTKMLGPVSLILVDSTTPGKYDRVYIDMNTDYVIDANDIWVDRDNPEVTYDWFNLTSGEAGQDGIPDVSGGVLYFIADGKTKLPYADRLAKILGVAYGDGGITTSLDEMPVPPEGEVLAFFGDFDYDEDAGESLTHGTRMASAIAGQGINIGDFGPILGMSTDITFLPVCNAHADEDSWEAALYFAVDGYDGIPNTGDEADIVTVGHYISDYNSGLDSRTQFIEFLANEYAHERATFLAPAGNDGSGFGTVAAPSGPSTIVVGNSIDNSFASENAGSVHHYGDVSELSSRGPTAAGLIKPDVVAIGSGEIDLPLGSTGTISSSVGGGAQSKQVWLSSDLACAVASGALALGFEAYYDAEHIVQNEVVVHATMNFRSLALDHAPVVAGSYTIWKNDDALSDTNDYQIDLDTGVITFTQNVTSGDWVNATYKFTNEHPWLSTSMDLIKSSATDMGYDPFTQGSGFVDAYKLAIMARGQKGLKSSTHVGSYGNTFGDDYSAFVNVLAPGQNESIAIDIFNEGDATENVDYGIEYLKRISVDNYTFNMFGTPPKHQKDITEMIPWNAQLVKVTLQTSYTDFHFNHGSYILGLYDWVDLATGAPGSQVGLIDTNDDVSFITSTDHPVYANALVCTLANPYANLNGSLMVEVKPDPDASPAPTLGNDVNWTITVEAFMADDWAWASLDKSTASIDSEEKDTVMATVEVPIDAEPGTYGASVVASYDSTTNYYNNTFVPEIEYLFNMWNIPEEFPSMAGGMVTFDNVLYDLASESYLNYTVDVLSCNVTWNGTPLTEGVEFTYDKDNGQITFTPPLVGQTGGAFDPELRVDYGLVHIYQGMSLPHKRVESIADLTIKKTGYDDVVQTLTENTDYTVNMALGTIGFNDTLGGKKYLIHTNYTYANRTSITPLSLNVYASDVANFAFGNISASEDDLSVMPVWALRPGYGSTMNSGDRRYFYINIPDQGLFTTPEDFYMYTEAIWNLNETDINLYILAEDEAGISPTKMAPYTLDLIGNSEEDVEFRFDTATHGPKEILLTPLHNKLVVFCVSAKSFNGSVGPIQKFEAKGGWISLDNQKKWTNSLVGHMSISAYTSFEFENGISASIVGPAKGEKTVEPISADDIEYDFTLEGWLSINANAEYTKVVTVENALSWDVHCVGLGGATDLDLAIFLDGHNGGNVDGEAQWMEIVTKEVCEFDAYKSNYGAGIYCYCADADADEALKLIAPPDGDYIIKVLGYTVNPSPGEMTLEIKTIFAGVEGYKMQNVETEFGDENPSDSAYLNETPILPYDTRSFDIMWSFQEDTEDNTYGGILVLGVPEAPELIVISVDIDLDREAPLVEPGYTGPDTITDKGRPSISADLFDLEKGEISQNVKVYLDGKDITTQSKISVEETEKVADSEDFGYWTGQALYIPNTPLTEGGHYYEVHCSDFANNTRVRGWYFTVDTSAAIITLTYPSKDKTYVNTDTVTIKGTSEPRINLNAFGASSSRINQRPDGKFTAVVTLSEGDNTVEIRGTDSAGNVYKVQREIVVDTEAPTFDRIVSEGGTLTNKAATMLEGSLNEEGVMTVNGEPATVNSDGTFNTHVELIEGENTFAFVFTDMAGNMAYDWLNVTLDTQAPTMAFDAIDTKVTTDSININGTTETGAIISINGKLVQVEGTRQATGTFGKLVKLSPGTNTLVIEARDAAGNSETVVFTVTYEDAHGTNWGAIGLMIVLLIVGLLIGIFLARLLFGEAPPKEEAEETVESEMDTVEELPEETIAETIVEPEEGVEEIGDEEVMDEELPDDEAMPDEQTEEDVKSDESMEEPEAVEAESEDVEAEPEADEMAEPEEAEPETMEEPDEDMPSEEVPADEDPRVVKLRQAYEEGKISKELYEKNLAKFQK